MNSDFEGAFLEYYAALAHHKIFPANLLALRYFFIDRFDYNLQLPGYEQLSMLNKIEFEENLHRPGRARNITINGKPETIPPQKRKLESLIRFLIEIVPAFLIVISLTSFSKSAVKALAGISLAILIFILGQVIWIYSIKRLLPRDYLVYRLPKVSFSFIARRLADFLWQEVSIIEK